MLISWFQYLFADNQDNKYLFQRITLQIIILMRLIRALTDIVNESVFQQMYETLIKTVKVLTKLFIAFMITLYSFFMIYATIGLEFFGGLINVSVVRQL